MPSTGTQPHRARTQWIRASRGVRGEPPGTGPFPTRARNAAVGPGRLARRVRKVLAGLKLLAALAIAYVALSGLASLTASRLAAAALQRSLSARRVTVSVSATPFWELLRGRFGSLHVVAYDVKSGTLSIARITARWQDGQVNLGRLARGLPFRTWAGGGPIRVTLEMTPAALMARLPHSSVMRITSMRLVPPDLDVRGEIAVGELRLPFEAVGAPAVAEAGRLVLFRVVRVHAGPISLRSALGIPVVDLNGSPLYPALRVAGATVGRRDIIVRLFGQAKRTSVSNSIGRPALR